MKRLNLLLIVLLLLISCSASSESIVKTASGDFNLLMKKVDALVKDKAFAHAHWGVMIKSLDNDEVWYAHNEERMFMPASNNKIPSTASALRVLGKDFKFETHVLTKGQVKNGVLHGDLVVWSNGDPTLYERYQEGKTSVFEAWADTLKKQGIYRITGDIIGDDNAFDDTHIGEGWAWDYQSVWYAAQFGALQFNENYVDVKIVPPATLDGDVVLIPNIETSYFKVNEVDLVESLIQQNTKILYIETPTNPAVAVLDLEVLGALAKKHNLLFVVDNCFATPYIQQPIQFGADLVIHSATKLIDGQGRVLGGVTVGSSELIREIYLFARNTGPAMSPFNAWVLSKSLETLSVRVEKHCENALKVAEFLEQNLNVALVKYPFLTSHPQYEIAKKQMKLGGNIVAFEIKGGIDSGRKFLDNIKMCSLSANLGDTRTIVTHPASTTHGKLSEEDRLEVGITDGLVRVSVGLEYVEDIIADLEQALEVGKFK